MKYLFSITYYYPYISGVTKYVELLTERLTAYGIKSTVLTNRYDLNLSATETKNNVEIIRTRPLVKISKGFISSDWIFKSWETVTKADIVFINLPQAEGFIPALFAKLHRKKVYCIYHCEVTLPKTFNNRIIQTGLEFCIMLSLLLANGIICYTEDYAGHAKLLKLFKRKISCIYPPVNFPETDETLKQEFLKALNLRMQSIDAKTSPQQIDLTRPVSGIRKPIIGFAARLSAEKGLEYLLQAIEQLDCKLAILGPLDPVGEEEYKKKIIQLAEQLKDKVVFLGAHTKMGSFYSIIDVLVLPSINSTEAFGLVQVEAMLMGKPVIATNLPGVRVPIRETGMGILVPKEDPEALRTAIIEVINNKQKYIKNASNVERIFNTEKTVRFYAQL